MSGEAKVVSFFALVLIALISINVLNTQPTKNETFNSSLKTEVKPINSPSDIQPVTSGLVKPILYTKVDGLPSLLPFEGKARFVDIVLPAILVAKYRIEEDRQRLKVLSESETWTTSDSIFLKKLTEAYKTDNLQ